MWFFKKEKVGRKRICYLFGIKVLSYSRGGGEWKLLILWKQD
ncbi:hypothetical protein [Helicobacter sp. MIT 01-3238]|nr:hypothetical protein [Helicobacter sp. MIT 01-3238]